MQTQMKTMKKFENLSFGERVKVVGESWGKLNQEQKEEYVILANEDKKRYDKEMKQLEKKGWFKNKDGEDSRDLYKPGKKRKSSDADQEMEDVSPKKKGAVKETV